MNRRHFIATGGFSVGAVLLSNNLFATYFDAATFGLPDNVSATVNNEVVKLTGEAQQQWQYRNLNVNLRKRNGNIWCL